MPQELPRLRRELDIMPSPVPEQPGLLIRDPFQFTDAVIIVPPLLAQALVFFDGGQTDRDLQLFLTRSTGDLQAAETGRYLVQTLDEYGFLESDRFFEMKDRKQREFAANTERAPAHVASAYPEDAPALTEKLTQYGVSFDPASPASEAPLALAAPHVSPEGGFRSYAAAYQRLNPGCAGRTFVILGTSHYGEPERFGLTRKHYQSPLGTCRTDQVLVDWLAARAGDAAVMEDYCHATEHSIEFQCVFLQHALKKPDVSVVPILCGPLAESLITGNAPEKNPRVRRFFEVLGEMAELHAERLTWVLGIDMAHIGRRYGDSFIATALEGPLDEVRSRDEARLDRVCAGDREGFFELVHPNRDDLRWCGYSPVYTFMAAVPQARGRVLQYEQWNIDAQSVVSFAGVEFVRDGRQGGEKPR